LLLLKSNKCGPVVENSLLLFLNRMLIALSSIVLLQISAHAQTSTYSNTSTNAINSTTSCGGNEFSRTFTVPPTDDFTVGDLDVGILITHTWRGDIPIDLESPNGTSIRIVNSNTNSGSQDNYNIELDDDAATLVNTTPHDTGDGTTAPPFENLVRPNNALSAFNGENSVGDWTLTMCDAFPSSDDGQFERADLYFTHITDADLSLTIAASDTTPNEGSNVVLTYTIANAGLDTDGVSAAITLPAGLSYVSDNGGGAYNDAIGIWTVPGTVSASTSVSFDITAFVGLAGPYTTVAEIMTQNQPDVDSTPGNGDVTEDDYDSLALAPITPPVPPLLCPGAASVLDWDSVAWPTASLSNSYTVNGETLTMTVVDSDGSLQSNATYGGQSPAETTTFTGGYASPGSSVALVADQPTLSDTIDISWSLGTAGTGVSQMQLTLFDVDLLAGQFQDQITILGTLNGSTVTPTITTGTANSASGSVVTGTAASDSNVGDGNLTIEFFSPIDSLVLNYGNGSAAGSAPGNQWIGISDLFFCPPASPAILTAQKSTEVYDPLSEGLYSIPGNDVIYTIEFTNTGEGDADSDSVVIIDSMPSEIEFYNGDIDDGGPQTDPVIGIDNGSGLSLDYNADINLSDVRYSDAATKPADFASCLYSPSLGYDPNVTFICFNPSGTMAAGDPDPSFELQFRARIK